MNKKLLDLIKSNEGFRSKVYKDSGGFETIGYGFTSYVLDGKDGRPSMSDFPNGMTREEADRILKEIVLPPFIFQVKSSISNYDELSEDQQNALVDLNYRNGFGNLQKSGVLDAVENRDFVLASELVMSADSLNKIAGKVITPDTKGYAGIKKRNQETSNLFTSAIKDPSSVIATEADEKPEISPLRQSVIDKFLEQKKDPNAERLMRAQMGDEMADKIIKGGEREIEEYVRSLDEDDLVKASDMTTEELANRIKAIGDQEPELKQEEEFVDEILNNPSLYSADLVKQAKDASKAIINYRARGMSGFSIFSDAKDVEKGITEELKKADLKGLLRKKSEQEGRLRDKQTGIKFKQITDPETGNLVTVEDIDLIGELPDAALPDMEETIGEEDASVLEDEDEDVTIELSKRKQRKALKKAGLDVTDDKRSKLTQFLKNAKLGLGDVSQAMNAAGFALSAGAGIMSIAEAREKDSVSKSQVDPLFTEAVNKVRAASETGMPYEQRQAAMKDINNAYVGAMKNVMAISGGQRGLALANVGVVDANRLNSLVDLASKDSDMRQKNLELFAKTSAEYSNQKLTADMNFQKLKATLDDNRKNRLADIGSNLLEQAQQYGANYTATRMADKLMDKQNDADRVQGAVDTFLQNNPAYLQSFYNELSGIDQDNNLDSNDG